MKTLLIILTIMVALPGCDQKPKNPVAEYGDTMIDAYQRGKQAEVEGNLYAVKQAVNAYHASNGTYPQKLDEIEPLLGGKSVDFTRYEYDPQSGKVTLKGLTP